MASTQDIKKIKDLMERERPKEILMKIPSKEKGIDFIIKYLALHDGVAYTNEIANKLNSSTARISAIINKLEKRNIVRREASKEDARKTIIFLTEKGKQFDREKEEEVDNFISILIDEMGMECLMTFINTTVQIRDIVITKIKQDKLSKEDK